MMMRSMNNNNNQEYSDSIEEFSSIEYDDDASLDEILDEIAAQEAEEYSELDFGIWAP